MKVCSLFIAPGIDVSNCVRNLKEKFDNLNVIFADFEIERNVNVGTIARNEANEYKNSGMVSDKTMKQIIEKRISEIRKFNPKCIVLVIGYPSTKKQLADFVQIVGMEDYFEKFFYVPYYGNMGEMNSKDKVFVAKMNKFKSESFELVSSVVLSCRNNLNLSPDLNTAFYQIESEIKKM